MPVQAVGPDEGGCFVDRKERQVVFEENQVVVGDLAVGRVDLADIDLGVEQLVIDDAAFVERHDIEGAELHAIARRQRLQPVERPDRSEEHTSELQSLMRISYAVFCLKKKTLMTIITIANIDNILSYF